MEQESNVIVDTENERIRVREFVIHDTEIVSYFKNLDERADLEKKLVEVIKMGIIAMKSIDIAGQMNYVDKAFVNLESNLQQQIEQVFGNDGKVSGILKEHFGDNGKVSGILKEHFGDNGQFSEILRKHFGEDGKIIKEIFGLDTEGSPLNLLRKDLVGHLTSINEKIEYDKGRMEQIEKSSQKGGIFEDACEKKLEWIANIHGDKIERTGNEAGKITGSKKGDFVITLGDIEKKIVFEMKARETITFPTIQKELNEAMENREAEYGVFIARNIDSLPKSVGWFNEYDGNKIACAIETSDGDSLIDGEMIHIAYKWARAKLRLESNKEKKLDPTFIIEKAKEIQENIKKIRKIKTECKNIENANDNIKETVINSEKEINKKISDIIESLEAE